MRAYHATARRSDGFTVYQRTQQALAEELGVDPGVSCGRPTKRCCGTGCFGPRTRRSDESIEDDVADAARPGRRSGEHPGFRGPAGGNAARPTRCHRRHPAFVFQSAVAARRTQQLAADECHPNIACAPTGADTHRRKGVRMTTHLTYGIEFAGVSKSYGEVKAVRSIDLRIAPGETVALLGAERCRQIHRYRHDARLGDARCWFRPGLRRRAEGGDEGRTDRWHVATRRPDPVSHGW